MKRRLSETEMKLDPKAADSDLQQTVAALITQQVASALLGGGSTRSFGRVAFASAEQQSVGAFLHQKLGKESLARRPGPGGRKLTYIESCKAIELANSAFGFNGWSCHIVECKEEFKEKKGDRWSVAYSSLVRIELKDGTSHEDVGFGSSDGQRDLGSALEQAKKTSISDARKRALRLFGEYLGNSCYDKEHIKDVNSNRPMAPLAAAPNVILPGQQGAARPAVMNRPLAAPAGQAPQPQQLQNQEKQQQQQWKPPQVSRKPPPSTASVQHQPAQTNSGANAITSRSSTVQAPVTSSTLSATNGLSTSGTVSSSSSTSPFRPQPQCWVSSNAPPPPRMMTSNYPPTIVKSELLTTVQARPNAQYNMEDLSLSQFDYDPNSENSNPVKRMRP
ncbi:DNA repair and recombination protein rad22 [Phytophthora ramorum]|uniref:DNA repair and recombination protein rad22 n=1 Tax=Phytophthora ramorum TaxID=164328 RepID=UPI00309C2D9F|nr:DNA repair and recombination protein rad22 [Phytophthora ramorum]